MRVIPLVMEFSQSYPSNSYGIAFVLIVAVVVAVAAAAAAAVVVAAVLAVVALYLTSYCNPIAIEREPLELININEK